MRQLRRFARENLLVVGILAIALAAALWFGFRVVSDIIYFNDPAHEDVALKGWMTPRYIVLTYDVPRPVAFEILGLPENAEGGTPLRDVAEAKGITIEELTEIVRDGVEDYREDGQLQK